MTPLNALSGTGIWYLLALISIFLVAAVLASLIRTVRAHIGKAAAALAFCNLLLAFFVFVLMMDCGRAFNVTASLIRYTEFEQMLFAKPWLLYGVLELLSVMLLALISAEVHHFQKHYLTPDAIRQTMNALPEGIAVIDEAGTVRLSNLRMNALCSELTSAVLSDAERFLSMLEEKGERVDRQLLLHTDAGQTWLFEDDRITIGTQRYRQLIAKDVTERYRIIEELKEENAHLKDIQRRMKEMSQLSADMFTAEEQARAKAALHNQLGQMLLMGQYYLNHPESTDPELVYLATRQMNRFLLGEAADTDTMQKDTLTEVAALAKTIGVTVVTEGNEPQDEEIRAVLAQAITECAANTVKHAEGDRLTVRMEADGAGFIVTLGNNGKPPKKRIAESGGLLSLRQKVETIGGSMTVDSAPRFLLTIRIPASQKNT